jgi:hypothetical protein
VPFGCLVPGVAGGECATGLSSARIDGSEGVAELGGQDLRCGGEACGRPEDLAQDWEVADDHRDAGGECLHRGEAEAFLHRREGEGISGGDQRRKVVVGDLAEYDRFDAEFGGAGSPLTPVGL